MKYKNNPFNIRYDGRSNWQGLSGHKNGFCEFVSLYYGVRACVYLLERTYKKRGVLTISEIIHTFAPASDGNNPSYYTSYVCQHSGVLRNDIYYLLNFDIKVAVLQAMASIETGVYIERELIRRVYYLNFK